MEIVIDILYVIGIFVLITTGLYIMRKDKED